MVFQPDRYYYASPSDYNLSYANVYFKSYDDTLLNGWWIRPKTTPKGTLLLVHGNAQNISAHFLGWMWAVEAGYELFIFDYRGYGNSDGTLDLAGAIKDVNAAMNYVEKNREGRYILIGQSLGGVLALNALANKTRPRVSLGIIDSSFSDLEATGAQVLKRSVITWPFFWLAYPLLDGSYNAIDALDRVTTPLLFVAGSKDTVISPNNSWQMFDGAQGPKTFWLDTQAHHIDFFENIAHQKTLLRFLKDPDFDAYYDVMKIYH